MASATYRFGEFRLDPARRELRRDDEKRELPLRAFQCLLYLLENRDRAVSHDELIEQVWGGAQMSDGVVAQAILSARRALDDTAQEPQFIDTVRGFGYRWAAPVDVEAVEVVEAPATAPPGGRSLRLWMVLAILVLAAVAAGAIYLWRQNRPGDADAPPTLPGKGEIALLLPVTVEADGNHEWVRLGIMALIAERLRAAGQAMVPSETVIALTRNLPEELDPKGLDRLTSTTGAHLVLGAHAEATGTRWRVSVRSLNIGAPPVTALAESEDVLEAARAAADRMALALGLNPASGPEAESSLEMLLRQTEAATLAQQMDVARELIESADAALREQPEVRLQSAWIEYRSHHLDAAQAAFESLLEVPTVKRDPMLQARVLHGLGGVHYQRGDPGSAEAVLEEAVRLLGETRTLATLGKIHRSLGLVTLVQGKFDAARTHLAQARRALKSTGDAQGLASLDNNLGVLEVLRDRYTQALSFFGSSADASAVLYDIGAELRNRANMVEAHLALLEPEAALALEPRLKELRAQTTNPEITALGNLARAALLAASGQAEASETLLADVLRITEARDDLPQAWTWASVLRAEQLVREGDLPQAARVAAEVVDQVPLHNRILLHDYLGRAWLVQLRARLSERGPGAAATIAAAMSDWADTTPTAAPKIYAALARAKVAAAEGQVAAAETAFEQALTLADVSQAPLRLLQVAESYVPWLLSPGPHHTPDPQRALLVADRVAQYADQDYGAALLQLRVYHALGPPSAWRAALTNATALAGERQIPPELRNPPEHARTVPDSQAS